MPDVSLGGRPDVEPGGQAFDVRREHVLSAAWDAHPVERAEENQVGGLAS